MSIIGKFVGGLRAEQSLGSTSPPSTLAGSRRPEANTAPLMRPEEAPRTVRVFPADFKDYRFVDSRLATFKRVNSTGEIERRRGIIAHMDSNSGDPNGAHFKIDSHYTLKDLVDGGHPDAEKIGTILNMQTDSCITAETGRPPEPTHRGATQKVNISNDVRPMRSHRIPAAVEV